MCDESCKGGGQLEEGRDGGFGYIDEDVFGGRYVCLGWVRSLIEVRGE